MATPPNLVDFECSAFNSSTTPKTSKTFTGTAGDRFAVVAETSDQGVTCTTPTNSGTVQTWTLEESVAPASNGRVYIWSCTLSVTQNFTVTVARTGNAFFWGHTVYQYNGSDGFGVSTSGNGSGAPSLLTSSLSANSALVMGVSDWAAIDGTSSRVYRSVNGSAMLEPTNGFYWNSSQYTVYNGYSPDTGAAGTETIGLSAPSGQTYVIAYLEILGTTGAAPAIPPELIMAPLRRS